MEKKSDSYESKTSENKSNLDSKKNMSDNDGSFSLFSIGELLLVAFLLICNCLNLMNVFGVFDDH